MGYLMHPYLVQDFWIKNRYWHNNPIYSEKTQKELDKWAKEVYLSKSKPEFQSRIK